MTALYIRTGSTFATAAVPLSDDPLGSLTVWTFPSGAGSATRSHSAAAGRSTTSRRAKPAPSALARGCT
eukprot:6172260-Pleurochrysis_carterae.AAC.2